MTAIILSLALIVATILATFLSVDGPFGLDRVVPSSVNVWTDTGLTVGLLVLLVSLFGLAYSVHEWRVRRLRWAPGPITVIPPSADSADLPDSEEFLSRFRKYLAHGLDADISVQREAPIDDGGHDEPFRDRLNRNQSKLVAPINGLVQMFGWPTTAYVVTFNLRTRADEPEPIVVNLQVSSGPRERPPEYEATARTLDDAALLAANKTCGQILPRTRLWRTDTYREWKTVDLSSPAFVSYQRANSLVAARRYDEALEEIYGALREEPRSLQLRVALAEVQERVGLFLDALLTLRRTLQTANATSALMRDGLRRNPWGLWRYCRFLWSTRHLALPRIRFRYATTLAAIEKTSAQWQETRDVGPERRKQRDEVRAGLRTGLVADYSPLVSGGSSELQRLLDVTSGTVDPAPDETDESTRDQLDGLFLSAADHEFAHAQRASSVPFRWLGRSQLRPPDVRLRRLAIEVRRRRLDPDAAHNKLIDGGSIHVELGRIGGARETALFSPRALHHRVRRAKGLTTWMRRTSWRADYAAATVYALAMQDIVGTPESVRNPDLVRHGSETDDMYAREAVKHLTRSIRHVPASDQPWLEEQVLAVDPDLAVLRGHETFRDFEGTYFMRESRPPPRPQLVQRFETSRYVGELTSAGAQRMADVWRGRREHLASDSSAASPLNWLENERQVLSAFAEMASDSRHSATRREFQRTLSAGESAALAPLAVPFPRFASCNPEGETVVDVFRSEEAREQRLHADLDVLLGAVPLLCDSITIWQRYVEHSGRRDPYFVAEFDSYLLEIQRLWSAFSEGVAGNHRKIRLFSQNAARISRPAADWLVDLLALLHFEARNVCHAPDSVEGIDQIRAEHAELLALPADDAEAWAELQQIRHRAYSAADVQGIWRIFNEAYHTNFFHLGGLLSNRIWLKTPHLRLHGLGDAVLDCEALAKAIGTRDAPKASRHLDDALDRPCSGGRIRARLKSLDAALEK